MVRRVAIVEAKRTPIGKFLGGFRDLTAVDLGVSVVTGTLETAGISPQDVDELIFGNARQAGAGPNPARQVAFRCGVPVESPSYTINMACASGLKSVALSVDSIRMGRASCVVAGGMESMTGLPFLLPNARLGYRLGHAKMVDAMYKDGFNCPLSEMVMGETAEVLASEFDISREEQDRYAVMSQNRAETAKQAKFFEQEILPVTVPDRKRGEIVIDSDEHPREGVTMAALAKLPAVFKADGGVTAGNASGITDGAAAVILVGEDKLEALGVEPIAWIRDFTQVGVAPDRMGIGPVPATRLLLERNEMQLGDIERIELNEAFAAQVIACDRELSLDMERVNTRGGAIALGHPIGATGARILVTLLNEMNQSGAKNGLATLCVSGGLGMALLVEKA